MDYFVKFIIFILLEVRVYNAIVYLIVFQNTRMLDLSPKSKLTYKNDMSTRYDSDEFQNSVAPDFTEL